MTNADVPIPDDTEPDDRASDDVDASVPSSNDEVNADATAENLPPHEKVRKFPTTPGVYLMKDSLDRVIYVGKAVNLRSRAGSYFTAAAASDRRTVDLIPEIADIDFIPTDSEVDALLLEARLIKDIQPRFNSELKDDKTFPYLQISTHEDFPRIEFTRKPETKGVKLYGPFTSAKKLRGTISVLQKIFRAGSVRASWRASISAPLRATCASARKTTNATSAVYGCFSTEKRRDCSRSFAPRWSSPRRN
jgi:hypothetical protein